MAEKETKMKLYFNLECKKCCKKVKKLLAKHREVREQKFVEKENYVFITVVCCSPEKIRDKLCYEAKGAIDRIEILEPPKSEPPPVSPPPKPSSSTNTMKVTNKQTCSGPYVNVYVGPCGGGRPYYACGCGCGRGCDQYFYEENVAGCTVM